MILMQGKGVSRGVAQGKLCFFRHAHEPVIDKQGAGAQAEKQRLARAKRQSVEQLEALAERCRMEFGDESAVLFETHAMLVGDEDYVEWICRAIEEQNCSAEYAVQAAAEQFAEVFAAMDDAYMQARAADIRDVSRRIIDNLTGVNELGVDSDRPVILAADDLAPSQTIQLDRRNILAFVTREGSENSHTAILARTMGIPAICGLGDALKDEYAGRMACVDGETGQLTLDPDEQTLAEMDEKQHAQQVLKRQLESLIGQEDVTLVGRKIDVCCNIGSPGDVSAVLANDGRGVGLFRSEFLYLASPGLPSEETQFQAYRSVVEAMNGRRVVIRTLDVGADKQVDYLGMKREENPALGVRAIRICLNRPEVFRPQLRALYRASAYGKIAIMFPMITSAWEIRECRRACDAVMDELDKEGLSYNRETEIGVMIETPASVLVADELAREVDFFSIGTNDLTQYTLACDRQCSELGRFFDPYHPAVLRSIRMAAEAAHAAGIWIGICGELAADVKLLPTFLDIGIDELSVSPSEVLPLRMEIRRSIAGAGKPVV